MVLYKKKKASRVRENQLSVVLDDFSKPFQVLLRPALDLRTYVSVQRMELMSRQKHRNLQREKLGRVVRVFLCNETLELHITTNLRTARVSDNDEKTDSRDVIVCRFCDEENLVILLDLAGIRSIPQ
jgi:hypothetical protein